MRGEDPHRIADWLAGCVRLARARDALGGSAERTGYEVPIGQGALDPPRFLAALEQAGFGGDIVLTRTSGTNPSDDLQRAREVFERMLE
jgi:sugar phosphate isomerase/epimerase